jgi:wyosine [tRNA(Phe)-imidazoG37] synthetase (radical SAM superfamily)
MADLRPEFSEIVAGWMLIDDFNDLTDRLERLAELIESIGGIDKLSIDEHATVRIMIESQIARGVARGDFEPFISGDDENEL